ncbi:MAG: RNA 2',3'-cyclic phosphodiesterase [Chlorobi bacterium]|nr:RNA 2',3'-cyclic phosphodiesterase [Chlorobiota bacterium]
MKRLFVAVKLIPDDNFLKSYYFLKNNLQTNIIKWVNPGSMHLTLKFLGETPDEKIKEIKRILKEFAQDKKAFNVWFDKCGIFGSSYKPRVIWFGASKNEEIKTLGNQLLDTFHEHGYTRDSQNFVPHLTVGRIKKITDKKSFQATLDKLKNERLQEFNIDEIILYQSILKPGGPAYIELELYNLL